MNETQFIEATEGLMQAVEDAVDAAGIDVDATRAGNVLTLEADSGEQVVINRHTPTFQMWVASRKGGLHFEYKDGQWINTRGGQTFWQALNEALSFACEETIELKAP